MFIAVRKAAPTNQSQPPNSPLFVLECVVLFSGLSLSKEMFYFPLCVVCFRSLAGLLQSHAGLSKQLNLC